MPCDTRLKAGQNPIARARETALALAKLEKALKLGRVKVKLSPNGALAFVGWDGADRDGVTDACAYKRLSNKNSFDLRNAIEKAQAESGVKLNERAIAAGVHSHDGGKTWGKD